MTIDIPGFGVLRARHLVLDYNGALALDGDLLPGVADRLVRLAGELAVHVVTADTFGTVAEKLRDLPCRLELLPPGHQDEAKLAFVRALGASQVVAVGNGRNDRLMLREAALGVAVLGAEGASSAALQAADVVCPDILSALALLAHPLRLTATLRL